MGCCCSSTLVDDHDSDTSKSGDTKQTPLVRNDTNENDRYVPNTEIMVPIATTNEHECHKSYTVTNISEIANAKQSKHCVLMLVDGYIRCIGKALNDQSTEYIINNIIPKSINQICFTYYYVCNVYMLYHLRELIASDRYGLTMYDIDEDKSYKCKIYNIKKHDKIRNPAFVGNTAIHLAKHISLPSKLNTILQPIYRNATYNVIFKCGGTVGSDQSFQCDAIIFDPLQYREDCATDLCAYHWTLPSLPSVNPVTCTEAPGTCVIYSEIYELLCIGVNGIYSLSLKDSDIIISKGWGSTMNDKWKWNMLSHKNFVSDKTLAHQKVCNSSGIMLDQHHLFVCGGEEVVRWVTGKQYTHTSLFDLRTNTWTPLQDLTTGRSSVGLYRDENLNRIYVGSSSTWCEYYDLNKQMWIQVKARTHYNHGKWPILWTNKDSNVLNIAGNKHMEYIDLRMQNKGWNRVTSHKLKVAPEIKTPKQSGDTQLLVLLRQTNSFAKLLLVYGFIAICVF